MVVVGFTEAGFSGADDGLGPVGHLKFGEDVGDMVADGLFAEDEATSDSEVVVPLGDELEHLVLTFGEGSETR